LLGLIQHGPALFAQLDAALELLERVGEFEFPRFELLDQQLEFGQGFFE